jgi:molybdenum cofactor biosynthesis enzyme MoaA
MREVTTHNASFFLSSMAGAAQKPDWEFSFWGDVGENAFEIDVTGLSTDGTRRVCLTVNAEGRRDDAVRPDALEMHVRALIREAKGERPPASQSAASAVEAEPSTMRRIFDRAGQLSLF